jgi:hypothetical protein
MVGFNFNLRGKKGSKTGAKRTNICCVVPQSIYAGPHIVIRCINYIYPIANRTNIYARYECITALAAVPCDVTLCGSVHMYQAFGGTSCLLFHGKTDI